MSNQQMLVGSRARVSLTAHNPYAIIPGVGTCSSTFTLSNTGGASGTVVPGGFGDGSYAPEWLQGGIPSQYSARWTTLSGSLSSGTAGSFLNLGTTRSWSRNATAGAGYTEVVGTVDIQNDASGVIVASATITLSAERG